MTNNESEIKSKKLTLGSKLSLNSPLKGNVDTVVNSTTTAVAESKKSKLTLNLAFGKTVKNRAEEEQVRDSDDRFNKRLDILKRAAQETKSEEEQIKYTSLSKLAQINQERVEQAQKVEQDLNIASSATTLEENQNEVKNTLAPSPAVKAVQNENNELEDALEKKKISDLKATPAKTKFEEPKKLNKSNILHMLSTDEGTAPVKTRSLASIQRARAKAKRKLEQKQEKIYREVILPASITVGELANRMSERSTDVIRELMKLGITANLNEVIDADTAEIVTTTLGHTVKRILESDVENILALEEDDVRNLSPRAPVVTVMGHVDHGKTSLLDALKSTDIVAKEAGGITQHIGAYKVNLEDNKSVTFIDTPGHEAFTAMRTRGVQITDIVILVVAADDGIKPQTIEAINHAKAANVPIIVAINKIDKPEINIEKVKNELLSQNLISEELGGDVMMIPISATKKLNLDKLLEAVLLTAEMLDLRANFSANSQGAIIESKINKSEGVIATALVMRGTLKPGDLIIAGNSYGRIRKMCNDKAESINLAIPSDPVEIYGLNEAPSAGDKFNAVQTEKQARDITDYRKRLQKEKKNAVVKNLNIDDLFNKTLGNDPIKELILIIKADVQGSIQAIEASLMKIPSNEVTIKIIHSGVGAINESDISLASASNAILIAFNVKVASNISNLSAKSKVEIRNYEVIYNLIDDIRSIVSGMLSPIYTEKHIGSAEIKQVFNITKSGKIAGSYVTKGSLKRGAKVKLYRDNNIIFEGKLKTLKRFKEDVKEVSENFECGIALENFENINVGDKLEVFEIVEEKQKLL